MLWEAHPTFLYAKRARRIAFWFAVFLPNLPAQGVGIKRNDARTARTHKRS
jgi:hypothetical protein